MLLVYWEDEELDWDAYEISVGWCKKEEIHTIANLKCRVVPQKDYEILWYRRCEKMQQDLETKKKTEVASRKTYVIWEKLVVKNYIT